jgi:hypothetical protein
MPRNEPLSLELSAELVDLLADFARADARSMQMPAYTGGAADAKALIEVERERMTLAHALAWRLLHDLPAFSAEGDLAAALNERDEVYAECRRSKTPLAPAH